MTTGNTPFGKAPLGKVPFLAPSRVCDDHTRHDDAPCPHCRPITAEELAVLKVRHDQQQGTRTHPID